MEIVVVKIVFSSNQTRFKTDSRIAEQLKEKIRSSKDTWINVETEKGGTALLKSSDIVGVEIEPYVVVSSKREGVTLREVCEVTGASYSTLVKKMNKDEDFMLDMMSPRRIRTSNENFDKLGLNKRDREILWKRERERLEQDE